MTEKYLVCHFMTALAKSLPLDASLLDAALTLRSTGFRHLPIVEGDRVVGLITDRDIHRFAPSLLSKVTQEEYNAVFENTPLERVMTRNPLTVTSATPLREAAAILHEEKVGCLPVVDNGRLVGILTVNDMLGALLGFLAQADGKKAPVAPH
ncbi:MAG TPA: CBS domain-containing protein [Candidatus Acidoferrales bacterium]|nr:CBS domain-containing protein [Candidatus Acidoferrales bacterium]